GGLGPRACRRGRGRAPDIDDSQSGGEHDLGATAGLESAADARRHVIPAIADEVERERTRDGHLDRDGCGHRIAPRGVAVELVASGVSGAAKVDDRIAWELAVASHVDGDDISPELVVARAHPRRLGGGSADDETGGTSPDVVIDELGTS